MYNGFTVEITSTVNKIKPVFILHTILTLVVSVCRRFMFLLMRCGGGGRDAEDQQ